MSNVKTEDRVKLAVKNTLKGLTTSEDIKAIIRFQFRETEKLKGGDLNDWELGLLGAHCVAFN